MELGKLQKRWVESLKKYGHRQKPATLGTFIDGDCRLCCLGQALVEIRISEGEKFEEIIKDSNYLIDQESGTCLISYKKIGLFTDQGTVFRDGIPTTSLSEMNDAGKPWSKIAEFIEENPQLIFKESK